MSTYLHFGRASSSVSKTLSLLRERGLLRLRCGEGPTGPMIHPKTKNRTPALDKRHRRAYVLVVGRSPGTERETKMTTNNKITLRATISYDTQDPGNHGWCYHLAITDADGTEHESGPLPHTRRDVSDATLLRSMRREYRASLRPTASPVGRLIARLDADCIVR